MYQLFYIIYIKSNIAALLGCMIQVMVNILKLHSALHLKLIYQSGMIYA